MLIFKISQNISKKHATYSSVIVIADSPEEARLIHPEDDIIWNAILDKWCYADDINMHAWTDSWVHPSEVIVELIGVAHRPDRRILCTSFYTYT